MKRVRVALGSVPRMVDSMIRGVLADIPGIEVLSINEADAEEGYDVLILNELANEAANTGHNSPSPSSGVVMVSREGGAASVFRHLEDLSFEPSTRAALQRAIRLAAGKQ